MKKRYWFFVSLLFFIGISFLLINPIQNYLISNMSNSNTKITTNVPKKNTNFNFSKIKSVDTKSVFLAWSKKNTVNSIGQIYIPSVKIKLPIFYGLDNNNLIYGAGTMRENQVMGKGNYALAGHHMQDSNLLFGNLYKVKVNEYIFIHDKNYIYKYKVFMNKRINEYDTKWINETHQPIISLITCSSGKLNESNRTIIRGNLISKSPIRNYT